MSQQADSKTPWRTLRRASLWGAIAAALVLEAWILWFEVPDHLRKHEWLLHAALAVSIVLLPLTVIAGLARLPIGRPHVTRRFIIRPFRALKTSSVYDGEAIAALLYRRIFDWRLGKTTAGRLDLRRAPEEAKFSFAGTSFSLPVTWLFSQLRYFLTGERDVVINGLLQDVGDSLRIRIWVEGATDEWLVDVQGESFEENLEMRLSSLSRDVLSALEPVLFARVCWTRGQYGRAVELLESQESSPEIDIFLIEIDLERDYAGSALKRVEQFTTRNPKVGKPDLAKLETYRAEALTKMGHYEKARETIQAQLRGLSSRLRRSRPTRGSPKFANHGHILRARLAATHFYGEAYEAALEEYQKAEGDALREAARILGGGPDDGLDHVVERCEYGTPAEELDAVLWELYGVYDNKARTQKALHRDPIEDYHHALRVLQVLSSIGRTDRQPLGLQQAVTWKAIAQRQTDPKLGVDDYSRALALYDECIKLCKDDLSKDEEDLTKLTDLAWSTHGRLTCLHRLFVVDSSGLPQAEGDTLFAAHAIAELMRGFPPQSIDRVELAMQRASEVARAGTEESRRAFGRAAQRLVDQIVATVAPEQLEGWLQMVLRDDEHPRNAADELEVSDEQISRRASQIGTEAPSDAVAALHSALVKTLSLLASRESLGLIALESRRIERDDAQREAWGHFELLWARGEKHHEAEAAYGLACFHSVLGETEEAVAWLGTAIDWTRTGDGFSAYRNRARLDVDLDGVRDEPSFRRLIYGEA